MGKYNSAVITTVGANVIAQALSGTELTWTVMRTSSTAIPAGIDPATLSSLTGIEQVSNITDATVYGNDVLQVSARFANTSISVAYLIQTVGIYGQLAGGTEVLIAVMTAVTPDEVPEYDPDSPSAFIFNVQLAIQNAPNVTMNVNDTGTATVADLNRKVDIQRGDISNTVVTTITTSAAAYPTVTAGDTVAVAVGKVNKSISDLSGNKLDKTGDAANATIGSSTASSAAYPIPAAGDSFKVILGKIRKFFTDIKAAVTGLTISGRTITYTRADGTTGTLTTQDTTYGLASTSGDGLLSRLTGDSSQWMRGDGTWQTAQNNGTTTAEGYVLDARMGKTLSDKIDVIAKISVGSMSSSKSCPANRWTAVASVNVSAGAYIVLGRAYCGPGNAGKMFSVGVGYGSTGFIMLNSVPVTINAIGFSASTADVFFVTGSTTFNVSVWPNSELTINDANITVVRIK